MTDRRREFVLSLGWLINGSGASGHLQESLKALNTLTRDYPEFTTGLAPVRDQLLIVAYALDGWTKGQYPAEEKPVSRRRGRGIAR